MQQCLEVRTDIEITKSRQYELQSFVEKTQRELIKQVTDCRTQLSENVRDL
jgi:hypothetical protein